MVMSPVESNRVLVKLSEVTQELTVGIGSATATVRTLADVSLEVRERELVVLSGSRGAGERALISVIAGDRRGVRGTCEISPTTRVRLMRITAQAALALTQEWQRAETLAYFGQLANTDTDRPGVFSPSFGPGSATDRSGAAQTKDVVASDEASNAAARASKSDISFSNVFLLDVVADDAADTQHAAHLKGIRTQRVAEARVGTPRPWNERNRQALLAWAGECRMRGGAIVMAASEAVGQGMFDLALRHVRQDFGARFPFQTAVREARFEPSAVRVVPMHGGRLAASVRFRAKDLAS